MHTTTAANDISFGTAVPIFSPRAAGATAGHSRGSLSPTVMAITPYVPGSTAGSSTSTTANGSIHAGNNAAATAAALANLGIGGAWHNLGNGGTSTSRGSGEPVPFVSGAQLEAATPAPAKSQHSPTPPKPATAVTVPEGSSLSYQITQAGPSSSSTSGTSNVPAATAKSNPFLNKLRNMVDDPATDDLIRWSPAGDSFVVPNHVTFGDQVLPRFFKHNRFSSFVRQLNMYGFHKVPNLQQGALKHDSPQEAELWEFRNEHFLRDRPELMALMQRKRGSKNDDKDDEKGREREGTVRREGELDSINGALMRNSDFDGPGGLVQLSNVWNAIKAIQTAQQGINDNLRHLHTANADLWREALESRQRSKKQEETINKMLRFLAGVFGAQDMGVEGSSRSGDSHGDGAAGSQSPDGRGGRRVVVRSPRKGRLLIGGPEGSEGGGAQIFEELEVPMDEDSAIEELPSHSRFTEANSASNSPQNASTPKGRFTNLPASPEIGSTELPPQPNSEPVATPGGSRRLSGQTGKQILDALASDTGAGWLASLLGDPSGAGLASRASTPGGGFKVDPQTVATLQSVLGQAMAAESSSTPNASYFPNSQAKAGQPDLGGWSGNSVATPTKASSTSNALIQSPRPRHAAATGAPNTQPLSQDPQQQQLALTLQRASQNLQNTSADAATVQGALNALIESLDLEPSALNLAQAAQQQAQPHTAPPMPSTSVPSSGITNGQLMPSDYSNFGGADPNGVGDNSDLDMDNLLSQFLETGAGENGAGATPIYNAPSPEASNGGSNAAPFAFSPATSAAFAQPTPGADHAADDVKIKTATNSASSSLHSSPTPSSSDAGSGIGSSATAKKASASATAAATAGSGIGPTRKRKPPAEFVGALEEDITRANERVTKLVKRKEDGK